MTKDIEPFGYFKAEPFGWTDCAETDDGAVALFAAPPGHAAKVAELEAENEKLRSGLENCRLFAARHRKEDWALLILGLCAESGVVGSTTR